MPDEFELYQGTLTGSEIDNLPNSIAIVADRNTHVAITTGQYVYVKNHNVLASGLYKAISNISANATLSSSNLSAVKSGSNWIGAANDLNNAMADGLATKAPSGFGIGEYNANLIPQSSNLNDIAEGGLYRWSTDSPTNAPVSGNAGIMLNFPTNSAAHGGAQIVINLANNTMYFRTYSSGWKAWKSVTAT